MELACSKTNGDVLRLPNYKFAQKELILYHYHYDHLNTDHPLAHYCLLAFALPVGGGSGCVRCTLRRVIAVAIAVRRGFLLGAIVLERGDGSRASQLMLNDRHHVAQPFNFRLLQYTGRIVQGFRLLHATQLGNPATNVLPLRVVTLRLTHGVEDAEVWLRIRPCRGDPLPTTIVGCLTTKPSKAMSPSTMILSVTPKLTHEIPINLVLHKVLLAQLPVVEQVLGQEGADNHSTPKSRIVHHPPIPPPCPFHYRALL